MLRWTKPGGFIALQEYDFRTWGSFPEHEEMADAIQTFKTVMEKGNHDIHLGCKLPGHFKEAGPTAPDGTDVAGILTEFSKGGHMAQAVYSSIFRVARKMGLADASNRRQIFAGIDETSKAGPHASLSPLLISAWKRKP